MSTQTKAAIEDRDTITAEELIAIAQEETGEESAYRYTQRRIATDYLQKVLVGHDRIKILWTSRLVGDYIELHTQYRGKVRRKYFKRGRISLKALREKISELEEHLARVDRRIKEQRRLDYRRLRTRSAIASYLQDLIEIEDQPYGWASSTVDSPVRDVRVYETEADIKLRLTKEEVEQIAPVLRSIRDSRREA